MRRLLAAQEREIHLRGRHANRAFLASQRQAAASSTPLAPVRAKQFAEVHESGGEYSARARRGPLDTRQDPRMEKLAGHAALAKRIRLVTEPINQQWFHTWPPLPSVAAVGQRPVSI